MFLCWVIQVDDFTEPTSDVLKYKLQAGVSRSKARCLGLLLGGKLQNKTKTLSFKPDFFLYSLLVPLTLFYILIS